MRRISCESCPNRRPGMLCDLPAEALADFRSAGVVTPYRPRQVIFSEGGPATGLYLVCHGAVKLYHSDRFGRDHILEIAGPGAVLGELTLDENATLSVSAEALTPTQVSFLGRERIARFIAKYPETGVRFIEALSHELAQARHKARDLALKGAESRLATLILQLARADAGEKAIPDRFPARYTRREMAEMIGVSTETAIRLLSKLKAKGTIDTTRHEIIITDPERLSRIANQGAVVEL